MGNNRIIIDLADIPDDMTLDKYINTLYYIPKIEEFHIGFEYEYQKEPKDIKCLYTQKVFNEDMDFGSLQYLIDVLAVRVRKLMSNDILDLGWENQEFSFNEEHWCFVLNRFYLYKGFTSVNNKHLKITNRFGDKVYFEGYIKNKYELSKLMQQLNIIENDR